MIVLVRATDPVARTRRASAGLAALVAVLAVLVPAAPASAVDQTFTFDDLAAGTVVSNQYAGRGLTFGPSVAGQRQATAGLPTVAAVGTAAAASGDRVGRVQRVCFSAECVGTAETWGSFSSGQARVSVRVGAFGTVSNTISLTAFDASGAQVSQASVSAPAGTFRTTLSASTTTAAIRFVRLRGSTIGTFGLDNLFASTTPSTAADFAISAPFGTHVLPQGSSVTIPVTLTRRNSSGTIRVSATGLPGGASVTAVDHTLATASATASSTVLNLRLDASATAAPVTDRDITITATPLSSSAGTGTRSQLVRMRLLVLFDVRVTGIEPSQGIQRTPFDTLVSATTRRYAGVPLQYNGRTIVRVYGNSARGGFPVSGVGARLFGFHSDGTALPGSPLFPDGGSRTLAASSATAPTFAERTAPSSAWTFTLPLSWTGFGRPGPGNVFTQAFFNTRLRAQVTPPSGSVAFRECDGCTANDTQTLLDVGYAPTCCVSIASAIITAQGGSTPRPIDRIIGTGLNLTPLEVDLRPYGTTLDLTDKLERRDDGTLGINRAAAYDALNRFNQNQGGGDIALGILSPEFSDGSGQFGLAVFDDLQNRPLTSSAHELAHALGRPHASPSCKGGGEAWPPDETGLIQGVGLDRTAASPYRLFATPQALDVQPAPLPSAEGGGQASAFYDLMSYCATEGNAWISAKGWTDTINRWPSGNAVAARSLRAAPSSAPPLQVTASADPAGQVTITSVRPLPAPLAGGFTATPFRLVVRDAQGAAVADVPLLGSEIHPRIGETGTQTFLTAAARVSPERARSVEVSRDGVVIASRVRSPNAPTGAFISPGRGLLVGRGRRVTIRWRAADRDGDVVEPTVEWSARGGRPGTWRTVFIGTRGGAVALPSEYFGGSERAFLRLRLSDGFNETVVLSPPFRTIHRAPTVRITAPRSGSRVRRDASLVLSAQARDEAGRPLVGRRLRWFDGRRTLGRGDSLRATRLRPGVHRIRVEARDTAGRRATARIFVSVTAVAPTLTTLIAPRRVARRARSVLLRVAASLPSKLVVSGGRRRIRALVGPRAHVVRVPIAPQAGLLRLRLLVSADGHTRSSRLEIDRR